MRNRPRIARELAMFGRGQTLTEQGSKSLWDIPLYSRGRREVANSSILEGLKNWLISQFKRESLGDVKLWVMYKVMCCRGGCTERRERTFELIGNDFVT